MNYSKDFVRFLTSVIWRIGVVRLDDFSAAHARFASAFREALQTWKDVLDGNRSDFGDHPVWFILLDKCLALAVHQFLAAHSTDGEGAVPAVNRYFANYLGAEVVVYETECYALIWGKTGSWLIVGVIAAPGDAVATPAAVSLAGGAFPVAGTKVPDVVLATFGHQAAHYFQKASELRPDQREKIKDDFTRNAPTIAWSDQARAMHDDFDIFGDNAFVNLPEAGKSAATTDHVVRGNDDPE